MSTPSDTLFPPNVAAVVGNLAVPGTTTNYIFEFREAVIRVLGAYNFLSVYRQANEPASPAAWDFWIIPGTLAAGVLTPADIKVYDGTVWQNITPALFAKAITYRAAGGVWREATNGLIAAPANKSYTVCLKAPFAGKLTLFAAQLASGTCNVDLVINGSSVQQLAASSTYAAAALSVNVAQNDKIVLTVSGASSPVDLAFEFQMQRG